MLIDVKNLFKIYHEGEESEVRALDGVSLSVDRGEFLAIIGQSGSCLLYTSPSPRDRG